MSTATPTGGLGVAATRGVFWTGGGQVLRQIIQIASSLVLARLLVPDDFGVLGMVLAIVGIGQLFADFGIGPALVQSRRLTELTLSSCFWANIGVGVLLALGIAAASPMIGAFYQRQDLTPFLLAASSGLILSSATIVVGALLYKNMHFGELAKARFAGSVSGAGIAIGLAWLDFGVWALVLQPLAGSAVTLAFCFSYARWRPKWQFSWQSLRPLAAFSGNVLGSDLLTYATRNADRLLIGRMLGSEALGFYSISYQLMLYPMQQVSGVVVNVLFPALSQLQDDKKRFRNAYLKSISSIALITFPMTMGMYIVSDDFVLVVLGEKWLPMLPVFKILVWIGLIQSVGTTFGTLFMSTGNVGQLFKVTLAATPLYILGMAVGLQWGIVGVAIGYGVVVVLFFCINLQLSFGLAAISVREFYAAVSRPLLAATCMSLVLTLVENQLHSASPLVRLIALIGGGILIYLAVSFFLNRSHIREVTRLIAAAVRKSA